MKLTDLPPKYQAQVQAQLVGQLQDGLAQLQRITGTPKTEKELQKACETLLTHAHYYSITPKHIKAVDNGWPCDGWYYHLHRCRENPMMPDLLIFDRTFRRVLPVELKVRNKWQPGQKEMLRYGWTVCWTVDEFAEKFGAWRAGYDNLMPLGGGEDYTSTK